MFNCLIYMYLIRKGKIYNSFFLYLKEEKRSKYIQFYNSYVYYISLIIDVFKNILILEITHEFFQFHILLFDAHILAYLSSIAEKIFVIILLDNQQKTNANISCVQQEVSLTYYFN